MRTPSSNYFYTTYDMYPVVLPELKKENKAPESEKRKLSTDSYLFRVLINQSFAVAKNNIRPASILLA